MFKSNSEREITKNNYHPESLSNDQPHDIATEHEKLSKLREKYIHKAAEEVRNPLAFLSNLIASTLKAQASGQITSDELNHRLLKAESRCNQLSKHVDDLLDLLRDNSESKLEVKVQETNICNVAAEVLERFVDKAIMRNCQLILDSPNVIIGDWDLQRLDQLISNLVSNAIKYAPGSIIKVKLSSNGSMATLEVSDQGPGIPLGKQSEIFNRFTKLEDQSEGFGIGLWLVKVIVERLYGTVHITSQPGKGATFTVSLPCRELLH